MCCESTHSIQMDNKIIKIEKIIAFFCVVYGALIAVGPHFIWGECSMKNGIAMKCHISGRVEIILGVFSIIVGLILLSNNKSYSVFFKVMILEFIVNMFAILVPSNFIGGCSDKEMHCQLITFPVLYMLSIIHIFLNICLCTYSFIKLKWHL